MSGPDKPGQSAHAYLHPVVIVAAGEHRFGWQLRTGNLKVPAWSVRTRASLRGAEKDIRSLQRAVAGGDSGWEFTAAEEDSEWWWTGAVDGAELARAAVGAWDRATALKKGADFVATAAAARLSRVLLVAVAPSIPAPRKSVAVPGASASGAATRGRHHSAKAITLSDGLPGGRPTARGHA